MTISGPGELSKGVLVVAGIIEVIFGRLMSSPPESTTTSSLSSAFRFVEDEGGSREGSCVSWFVVVLGISGGGA